MGSNGIVTERAQHNIDKEKYDKEHNRIFGTREKLVCSKCDLSSRQKPKEDFLCPHCNTVNFYDCVLMTYDHKKTSP